MQGMLPALRLSLRPGDNTRMPNLWIDDDSQPSLDPSVPELSSNSALYFDTQACQQMASHMDHAVKKCAVRRLIIAGAVEEDTRGGGAQHHETIVCTTRRRCFCNRRHSGGDQM